MGKCEFENIPKYLHKRRRKKVEINNNDKLLLRIEPDTKITEIRQAFRIENNRMSCNLKSLCTKNSDVLYNPSDGRFLENWKIGQIDVLELQGNIITYGTNGRYLTKINHEPIDCMYPHSEIRFCRENGDCPRNIKSELARHEIKNKLLSNFNLIIE